MNTENNTPIDTIRVDERAAETLRELHNNLRSSFIVAKNSALIRTHKGLALVYSQRTTKTLIWYDEAQDLFDFAHYRGKKAICERDGLYIDQLVDQMRSVW